MIHQDCKRCCVALGKCIARKGPQLPEHFAGYIAFNALLNMYWNKPDGTRMMEGSRLYPFLESANYVGANNPKVISLIKKMKANNAAMTTSLHFFAQYFGLAYFNSVPKAQRFVTAGFSA